MTTIPSISVQLVHMQGPLKGEIQEIPDSEILIGRHPDCQVLFPRDMTTLSRIHAKIIREGNRFKLIDQSTNGTFVNGQKTSETYLKDGDVVMFSEGGPKVSFLTQTQLPSAQPQNPPENIRQPKPATMPAPTPRMQAPPAHTSPTAPMASAADLHSNAPEPPQLPATPPKIQVVPDTVKAPFAIQYGPSLKSFQTLPIVIGNASTCDFRIPHPALSDRHAQIFFASNRYWIKDLSATRAILVNGVSIADQTPLEPDMQIDLSPGGPKFRFISGGRFVEIEDVVPEPPAISTKKTDPAESQPASNSDRLGQKAGSLFKKIFGKEPL
jgi:pSer/pThr/pTyr-binding forkhead associated (FHA) protein